MARTGKTCTTFVRTRQCRYVCFGDRKKEGIFPNLSIFENLLIRSTGLSARRMAQFHGSSGAAAGVRMGIRQARNQDGKPGQPDHLAVRGQSAEGADRAGIRGKAQCPGARRSGARHRCQRQTRSLPEPEGLRREGQGGRFLSSEIEEFLNLCTRVLVFRNGAISSTFGPPYDGHVILNAMFGRRASAGVAGRSNEEHAHESAWRPHHRREEDGHPIHRPLETSPAAQAEEDELFDFAAPDIPPGPSSRNVLPRRTKCRRDSPGPERRRERKASPSA